MFEGFVVQDERKSQGRPMFIPGFLEGGSKCLLHRNQANSLASADAVSSKLSRLSKFSKKQLALAFVVAGISDLIGAFATLVPPIGWALDIVTAALLFMVLGWQWLLLPGLALEAIPGVGVVPFWLLVVGAIAVLGTPRPKIGQH